jgi:hypothetical protein
MYVDDVLLIYNETLTDAEDVLSSFNDLTPSLNFTIEREKEKLILLDISIIKKRTKYSSTYTKSLPFQMSSFRTTLATRKNRNEQQLDTSQTE